MDFIIWLLSSSFSKQKLSSGDISSPSDFRHVQHVGYNREEATYDISAEEGEIMREILQAIGEEYGRLNHGDLKFAYNYLQQHGGLTEVIVVNFPIIHIFYLTL